MVSATSPMQSAIAAVNSAFARLEEVVAQTQAERAGFAELQAAEQAELSSGWQTRTAQLEADLAEAQAESEFLKEDHTRLSNQLQKAQQELLALQSTAKGTLKKLDSSVQQLDMMLERA